MQQKEKPRPSQGNQHSTCNITMAGVEKHKSAFCVALLHDNNKYAKRKLNNDP